MNDTLTVRLDPELKRSFIEIVETLGLDAPTAIRMFATQTVRNRALPLSLSDRSINEQNTMHFLDTVRSDWGEW